MNEFKQSQMAQYEVLGTNLIIRFKMDLDHHVAEPIRRQADWLIQKDHVRNIVFDFSGAQFLDSSGIGMLMGRYKQIIFQGGKAAVTGIQPPVDRILRISGIYNIMEKYDTAEDAMKSFQ
ncbi:MAG: anti-sigma factor antagonist [Clostridiales bacterium]|nr:anti-sigma factor antagonist [Clostridiales bacterium]